MENKNLKLKPKPERKNTKSNILCINEMDQVRNWLFSEDKKEPKNDN